MSWGFIKTLNKHFFQHFINVDDVISITKIKTGSYPGSPEERFDIKLKSTSEMYACDHIQFVTNGEMKDIRHVLYPGMRKMEEGIYQRILPEHRAEYYLEMNKEYRELYEKRAEIERKEKEKIEKENEIERRKGDPGDFDGPYNY